MLQQLNYSLKKTILGCLFWLMASVTYATTDLTERHDVQAFIQSMVKKHGFSATELNHLFKSVKIRPQVMQSLVHPFEEQPWYIYQRYFVTPDRITQGVAFWDQYNAILSNAERQYGVPASLIVATIGVESKYGARTGNYPVIESLSNIAFSSSKRAAYFRSELEQFLLLTHEQHLNPLQVMGSYAGAIGQPQFMPSSYRRYAVSYAGGSSIDLSNCEADVIASVANYYKLHGWIKDAPIVIPADIKTTYPIGLTKPTPALMLKNLVAYGITPRETVTTDASMKILSLQGKEHNEYWLTFNNFDVIRRYNTSSQYALAVYELSQYIKNLRQKM